MAKTINGVTYNTEQVTVDGKLFSNMPYTMLPEGTPDNRIFSKFYIDDSAPPFIIPILGPIPYIQYFKVVNGKKLNYMPNGISGIGFALIPGTKLVPAPVTAQRATEAQQAQYNQAANQNLIQNTINTLHQAAHDAGVSIGNLPQDVQQLPQKSQAIIKKIGDKIGDKLGGGKALHALNKYDPYFIAIRAGILGIFRVNLVGIATAFNYMKAKGGSQWDGILQKWWLWGGDKDAFNNIIKQGQKEKELFKNLLPKKLQGFSGSYSYATGKAPVNVGTLVAGATAGLSAISGILLALPDPTAAEKALAADTGTAAVFMGTVSPLVKDFAAKNGATQDTLAAIPDTPPVVPETNIPTDPATLDKVAAEIDAQDTFWGLQTPGAYFIYGLGGVAAIFGIALLIKKIRNK